jgi:hypothetical protein
MTTRWPHVVGGSAVQLGGRADRDIDDQLGVEVRQRSFQPRHDLVPIQPIFDDVHDWVGGKMTRDASHATILVRLVAVDSLSEVLGCGLVC